MSDKKPQIHRGPDNSAPYPVSRLAPHFDLTDLAGEIEQADAMLQHTSHAKLKLIAEQINQLKQQARGILEDAQKNQALHYAACNFKKIPGKTYHLYQKANGQHYFSMLSPAEWGPSHADEFMGSYTLQADMSWQDAQTSHNENTAIEHLLDSL